MTSSFRARSLPNVLVINSRSIRSKIEELVYYVNEFTIQIIIVTETWLSGDIPDNVINIPGFILIRKDRHNGFGGGCAIYVSDEIPMKIRNELSDTNIESQWLTLRPKWLQRSMSRLAMASVYLSPSIDRGDLENFYDYFQSCYDILSTESPDTGFTAAKDFNPCSNSFDAKYLTKYCDVNLKQVVKAPTRNSNVLDLFFTNIGISSIVGGFRPGFLRLCEAVRTY